MLRKNVSISDTHLKLLDPLLKKHQGNLSAAMRDIIDFTGFVTENMGSLETAKDLLKEKNNVKEQIKNRIYGITIPLTMFRWLLINRIDDLPPLDESIQLFQPHDVNIYDINTMNKIINEEISLLNWPVSVSISCENSEITVQITGMDVEINKFSAILIGLFLANNEKPQKVNKLLMYPSSIYVQLTPAENRDEAVRSVYISALCNENEGKATEQNSVLPLSA